ncbi:MAG TPA: biopolymer transporter ExbD [Pirellulaceae bacterium]
MRIRHVTGKQKIEMQMTPMIDIVFNLLIFFIMSFKIAALEGDFRIKMPAAAKSSGIVEDELPPMTLRLVADDQGQLAGIQLNDIGFATFSELHRHILGIVGSDAGPGLGAGAEVELDCDYDLRYAYVMEAITAILGDRQPDGTIVKLIEKIRFAPPKKPR